MFHLVTRNTILRWPRVAQNACLWMTLCIPLDMLGPNTLALHLLPPPPTFPYPPTPLSSLLEHQDLMLQMSLRDEMITSKCSFSDFFVIAIQRLVIPACLWRQSGSGVRWWPRLLLILFLRCPRKGPVTSSIDVLLLLLMDTGELGAPKMWPGSSFSQPAVISLSTS